MSPACHAATKRSAVASAVTGAAVGVAGVAAGATEDDADAVTTGARVPPHAAVAASITPATLRATGNQRPRRRRSVRDDHANAITSRSPMAGHRAVAVGA